MSTEGFRERDATPKQNHRGIGLLVATALTATLASVALADDGSLLLELNKLEAKGNGCRAYIVVTNKKPQTYSVFKLDLIQFQPDGLIGKRFAIDLGPIKPSKRVVKLFDMEETACDQIGSFLINDVLECQTDQDPKPDCLAEITSSSLTKAQLTK